MNPKVFIDNDYPEGKQFCEKFLSSPDFTVQTLKTLTKTSSSDKKEDIARKIAEEVINENILSNQVLLAYVKQSRMWLSVKLREQPPKTPITPQCTDPQVLLQKFGEEGWYGPISDNEDDKKWYIRTCKIKDYIRRGIGDASQIDTRNIRWTIIAEVNSRYIALSWNGFSSAHLTDDNVESPAQFPFWNRIPDFLEEITKLHQAQLDEPNLLQLVLHDMWAKYLRNPSYRWQHLRIRAEASGVALNAHSAGISEIDASGLQALSKTLAKSALEALGFVDDSIELNLVENALLRTLLSGAEKS